MRSADLLRNARLRAGLTQAELARRAGRHQSAIARWESGRATPSFETLRELVRACGLELVYGLANGDHSYLEYVDRQLALAPAERLSEAAARANTLRGLTPAFEARDR